MATDRDSMIDSIIREEIRALKPYRSPRHHFRIKLDLNESPFDLPVELKKRLQARVESLLWQRYHDEFEEPLREALAAHLGMPEAGILIGNGSNELIFHSLLAAVRHGDPVLIPEPSFSLYRQNALVLGGEPLPFTLKAPAYLPDPEEVLALAASTHPAAVVLCSPNNPTGGLVPTAEIARIAEGIAGLVVVDEAYAQFAEDNCQRLVADHPNLIVLRTFSKYFGLAGLRFGYSVSGKELAEQIAKVQLPHHVNFFTQLCALELLAEPELIAHRTARGQGWKSVPGTGAGGPAGGDSLPQPGQFRDDRT